MADASHPQKDVSRSGQQPGEGAPKPRDKPERKRPVEEEDTFGGVERAQRGEPVDSENAKP